MKKILVAYYSWSNGNTRGIAEKLQTELQADLVRIECKTPYKGSYEDVVAQGQQEVQQGFQPIIKPLALDPAMYDVIAIGTPTWWYTMAPAVLTFIKGCSWAGKVVIPFATNGGWPGHVLEDMKKCCAGASFLTGLEVRFDSTGGSRRETGDAEIDAWILRLKEAVL